MEHAIENEQDRKRTNWRKHIDEWLRSGLSQQDYCRSNGLALSSFGYWRRKLKSRESAKPCFYPLVVATEANAETGGHDKSGLRVMLGRFAIEIGDQFSPGVLQKLVTALEQL